MHVFKVYFNYIIFRSVADFISRQKLMAAKLRAKALIVRIWRTHRVIMFRLAMFEYLKFRQHYMEVSEHLQNEAYEKRVKRRGDLERVEFQFYLNRQELKHKKRLLTRIEQNNVKDNCSQDLVSMWLRHKFGAK